MRKWKTPEERQAIVQKIKQDIAQGKTRAQSCRDNGISMASYGTWKKVKVRGIRKVSKQSLESILPHTLISHPFTLSGSPREIAEFINVLAGRQS